MTHTVKVTTVKLRMCLTGILLMTSMFLTGILKLSTIFVLE
jgi:hypothetical protein